MMLALLLFACATEKDAAEDTSAEDSVATEDSDPSGWAREASIRDAGFSCGGTSWRFALITEGWIDGATLSLYQVESLEGPATLVETHPFPTVPTAYDPFGAWDQYTLTLAASTYIAGESTASPPCDLPPGLSMAYRVGIFDRDGVEVDCMVWGTAPEAADPGCL